MLAVAEAGAELEEVFHAGGEEAFHGQFGGGAQPTGAGGGGVDIGLGGVGGQEDGGVDLEKAALAEEAADGVGQLRAQIQNAAQGTQGVGIGGSLHVRGPRSEVRGRMETRPMAD
jgi:hypothetical protein